jgi:DNA-binding beta-propeller fold protein YncE
MKSTFKLARSTKAAAAVVAALAAFAIPASADSGRHHEPSGAPVFVQTDNTAGNAVVAYHRAADGSLGQRGTYRTGGKGGVLKGSVVDHLASQGSLTYDRRHKLLYAVNAGSNTITVFSVAGDRLHRQQVVSSGGTFPVSVTVHDDLVYVLNARDGGSIQGYQLSHGWLHRVPRWNRSLDLGPAGSPEFTHTPGQISFAPGGSHLIVTTKAGGHSIEVFPLSRSGAPSDEPLVSTRQGSVPFGFTFDRDRHLVVSDSGSNSVLTYSLHRDGEISLLDERPTRQLASCWIVRSDNRFYVSNAGSDTLSGFQRTGRGDLKSLGNTPTGPGPVDSAVTPDGRYLYVQTGGVGGVDAFRIDDGSLTKVDSVLVPGAIGGEGIAVL